MGAKVKTIHVSHETWKALQVIKLENGFRSLDEAIRFLLEAAGVKGAAHRGGEV